MLKRIFNAIQKKRNILEKRARKRTAIEENRKEDVYHDERDIGDCDFEFLIRRVKKYEFSDDFEILQKDYINVLTPDILKFTNFELLDYEYCTYKVLTSKVSVTSEFVGIQIVIENNGIKREVVKQLMTEIRNNIQDYTNHSVQIFEV